MTHLPFVAASYALCLALILGLAATTWLRLRAARRILNAIDPRARRADSP